MKWNSHIENYDLVATGHNVVNRPYPFLNFSYEKRNSTTKLSTLIIKYCLSCTLIIFNIFFKWQIHVCRWHSYLEIKEHINEYTITKIKIITNCYNYDIKMSSLNCVKRLVKHILKKILIDIILFVKSYFDFFFCNLDFLCTYIQESNKI